MTLKIYNTLTKKKEEFKPIKKGEVGIYLCGPTVNGVPHLGHARARIVFDVLRKYFIFLGYKVKFVSNITDIDDKIINKAKELKLTTDEVVRMNEKEHIEDYSALGVLAPDFMPHATEYIKEMIELIKLLEKKSYTYEIPEDGIYYDVSKFENYGKLSGINLEELQSKRKLIDSTKGQDKKDKKDFVLWKFSKPDEPKWDSPWGAGRPGWHIECSAMTHTLLGNPFDIHAGGQDLIFPHHEDEIAQSEAGYGKKMANYWMHNGMINIEKVKMSKSLGNYTTIKEILKEYSPEVIRYFILSTNYRKSIDFSKKFLDEAKTAHERLKRAVLALEDDEELNKKALEDFENAMNEELNTAGALQVIWNLVKEENAEGKIGAIKKMDEVLGLKLLEQEKLKIPKEISELIKERDEARKSKNWKKSDDIRDKLKNKGFNVLDSPEGTKVEKL